MLLYDSQTSCPNAETLTDDPVKMSVSQSGTSGLKNAVAHYEI